MIDPRKHVADTPLLDQLVKALQHVPEATLKEFKHRLFPLDTSSNIYQGIINNMALRLQARDNRGVSSQTVGEQIIAISKEFGAQLHDALFRLIEDDFMTRLKLAILPNSQEPNDSTKELQKKNKKESRQTLLTKADLTKRKNVKGMQKWCTMNKLVELHADEIDQVANIEEGYCLCQKFLSPLDSGTFRCSQCSYFFHFECMRKTINSPTSQCLFCNMGLMIPNRPTKKQLFAGVMQKGRKKHEISFSIDQSDLQVAQQKMQIRCFRLKEITNNFILFPDFAIIEINDCTIKEFAPIHRQSSLKYRKDEPVVVDHKRLTKKMKVVVSEDMGDRDIREDRLEYTEHLIACYLVEDVKCEKLCQAIEAHQITSFNDSMKLLNFEWRGGSSNIQEISLEMIKIPLTCVLTTERMKVPVRGIYCQHFQCFDLHNFVFMIAQSSNPRWVCPLCRLPAYRLKVDTILSAILEQHCKDAAYNEVLFFRSGEYSISKGKQLGLQNKRNVQDLSIQGMRKRKAECMSERGNEGKGSKEVVISLLEEE